MARGRRTVATLAALVIGSGLALGLLAPSSALAAPAASPSGSSDDVTLTADLTDVPATAASAHPKEGDVSGHRRVLLVKYTTVSDCVVHANYPVPAGHDRTWTVTKGMNIIWRYNVTGMVAAVADPNQKGFPHWGFVTDRSCIGTTVGQQSTYKVYHHGKWVVHKTPKIPAGEPVPSRILSGRSQFWPYWVKVDWRPSHGAIPTPQRTMTANHTLRDVPNAFVVGNVYKGWHVRTTAIHRQGYTKVYVIALNRWGWLQI